MPYYPPRPNPEQPPEEPRPRKQTVLKYAVLCISVLLLVYGVVKLVQYGLEYRNARQTSQELRDFAAETAQAALSSPSTSTDTAVQAVLPSADSSASPDSSAAVGGNAAAQEAGKASSDGASAALATASPVPSAFLPDVPYPNGYQLVSKIRKLRTKSEYIIGWLTMEELDEPVVLKDNDYFLDHDALGKHNSNGAIFMDQDTNLLTRPYTILLYGHNMKSGAMFGNLHKYNDYAYCFRHRIFQFDTLYEEGQYAIFAVETINLLPGHPRYLNLAALQSSNREMRSQALRTLVSLRSNDTLVDVDVEDQLLLLITCVGNDDERLILAARRVRDGESLLAGK